MKSNIVKGVAMGCTLATLFTAGMADARPSRAVKGAKYVFFFLGDGMASVQMQAAEAYLASQYEGGEDNPTNVKASTLNMNLLPVSGLATTYSDTRFITDSAAAGTAFACGVKTDTGVIGLNTDRNVAYKSIADLAHEQGKSVGIISSVSLPHATPAAYYAKVNSRNNYAEIGYQASQSDFEFFGGGWFRKLASTAHSGNIDVATNDWTTVGYELEANGYMTVTNIADALAQPSRQKVICSVATSYDSDAMPYRMDKPAENFTLAEVTQCAIDRLEDDAQGFFIMVEGGKIDWACHANDAMASILDTVAFDDAVGVAMAFLNAHPTETLIVVTGDHETGGMTLGYAGNGYQTAFDVLGGQVKSYDRFVADCLNPYKQSFFEAQASNFVYDAETCNIDQDVKDMIEANFGLIWDDGTTNALPLELTDAQKEELEAAFDRTMANVKDSRLSGYDLEMPSDVDYTTYGGYEALSVTLCHILNKESGLAWTSTSHTAVPVPVMAAGFDAYRFCGFYDNTDIAKKLGQAMRTKALPVVDPDYSGGGLSY